MEEGRWHEPWTPLSRDEHLAIHGTMLPPHIIQRLLELCDSGIDMKTQRPRLCDIAFSQLLLNTVQIHAGKTGHGLVHQAVGTSKHGLAATGRVAAGWPAVVAGRAEAPPVAEDRAGLADFG